ncbi:MAG: NAD(P)-binding protein [Thaumarchaeota archaeon]|nr:NAD(P)-binding protein [Nitrososphaerota archaeon]
MNIKISSILFAGLFLTSFVFSQSVSAEEVPGWIKNNAAWWAEGTIDDTAFLQGIQFLIKEGIVSVEQETPQVPMRGGEMNVEESSDKIYDVIVIGAGMAGITAADKLDSEGFDVLVLEARDRTGGRTWTMYWDAAGMPVDMGAGWIHGNNPNNPITQIAEKHGIELFETVLSDGELYGPDGQWLEYDTVIEIESMYAEFMEYRWEYAETTNYDTSIKEAEDSFVKLKNLSTPQQHQLRYMINSALEHEESADAYDLSLWTEVGKPIIGSEVIFPGGYVQIFDTLDDDLNIKLEHVVSKVTYDDQGVIVTTNKGDFNSKYVISTLPMGVLKSGDVEFSPSLPADKQKAIERIGMGAMNKLYLLFDDMFWDDVTLINYVSPDGSPMWEFFNLNGLGKPILLGFTAGDHSRQLEQLSDDEIIADAMSVIQKMYGDETLEPVDYVRTKWSSDPYSKGAYSYTGVGGTEADYTALAKPVMNRVFFAGEATYVDFTATVNGAYLSGLREAANISALN